MDSYVSWREQSASVELTYERWKRAAPGERHPAYDAYFAALNREEQAAANHRRMIERVGIELLR